MPKFYLVLFLIVFGLSTTPSDSWAQGKWQTFSSPAGNFSVLMPGTPQWTESVHKSFVGAVKENTYTVRSGKTTYSASYSELPGIAVSLGGSHTIFNKAKDGLLKEAGGTENGFKEISLGGSEGRELNFLIDGGWAGKARFYLVEKRLYVIVASGPASASATITRFLNSFKLLS